MVMDILVHKWVRSLHAKKHSSTHGHVHLVCIDMCMYCITHEHVHMFNAVHMYMHISKCTVVHMNLQCGILYMNICTVVHMGMCIAMLMYSTGALYLEHVSMLARTF